jgi:hypothetical protein
MGKVIDITELLIKRQRWQLLHEEWLKRKGGAQSAMAKQADVYFLPHCFRSRDNETDISLFY